MSIHPSSTSGVSLPAAVSRLLLRPNPRRKWAILQNDGVTIVYIGVGKDAVIGEGIRLNAQGGSVIFDTSMPFEGAVYGISSASCNVLVNEGDEMKAEGDANLKYG